MDPELVSKMFDVVNTLGAKQTLKGPELAVYLRGLTFVEKQFQLYNLALEQGIDELNRSAGSSNSEDFDPQSHPPNYFH